MIAVPKGMSASRTSRQISVSLRRNAKLAALIAKMPRYIETMPSANRRPIVQGAGLSARPLGWG
jgi:hypothetical protein